MPSRQTKIRRAMLQSRPPGGKASGKGRQRPVGQRRQPVNTFRSPPGLIRQPVSAPAGLGSNHHFNAFGAPTPQALAFSVGPATHITGANRFLVSPSKDHLRTCLLFQPGGKDQAIWVTETSLGTWNVRAWSNIASSGIELTASASSPDTIMCSRGSIRIRNLTPAGSVGGAVHVLNTGVGLPDMYTVMMEADAICDLVTGNPRTVSMSGSELTQSHQWDCIPVSQDKYHQFEPPTFARLKMGDPGISTIIVVFDHVVNVSQNYEISMAGCWYARYKLSGPLSNISRPPPTKPLALVNSVRDVAEAVGSMGRPVVAALGSIYNTAQAAGAVGGMLGNLVAQGRPFQALPRPMLMP